LLEVLRKLYKTEIASGLSFKLGTAEFDEIFSGYQTWMLLTQVAFETLVQYGHLTWLIAREDYIKFCCRES
jgi:hypothetical protein